MYCQSYILIKIIVFNLETHTNKLPTSPPHTFPKDIHTHTLPKHNHKHTSHPRSTYYPNTVTHTSHPLHTHPHIPPKHTSTISQTHIPKYTPARHPLHTYTHKFPKHTHLHKNFPNTHKHAHTY